MEVIGKPIRISKLCELAGFAIAQLCIGRICLAVVGNADHKVELLGEVSLLALNLLLNN